MTTLAQSQVQEVLSRLYAEAKANDSSVHAEEEAVASAAGNAKPGEIVLLAPACASFDQFENFEQRGDAFRSLVAKLSPSG